MRIKLNNSCVGYKDIDPAGGTIAAPLRLAGTPTNPLEAVSSSYVLNAASSFTGASVTGVFSAARLPAYTGIELSSVGNGIFTLSNTGVTAGTYAKVTVDAKGRVTGSGVLLSTDIPNLSYTKLIDKPTTLAGYGITDVVSLSGGVMTGALSLNGVPTDGTHLVSKSYVDARVSGSGGSAFVTGDVVSKSSATTPSGFLRCNGGNVSKTTYASLFSVIGETYVKANYPSSGGKPWVRQYDFNQTQSTDIIGWTTPSFLPVTIYSSTAIVTKNRVYLLGGTVNNSASSAVYTAPILADGTLGTWMAVASLPRTMSESNAVVIANRVYLFSDFVNGATTSTAYTATINPDGTLGTWTTSTSLPVNLSESEVIVTSSHVYLMGGRLNGSPSSAVYAAPILADGVLGAWVAGVSLPVSIIRSQAIIVANVLYLIGGLINGSWINGNQIYKSTINSDGTLGSWSSHVNLPFTFDYHRVFCTKNKIYLISGQLGSINSSSIYTAVIRPDGTFDTWVANQQNLPASLLLTQVITTNSKIYLLGGLLNGTDSNNIYMANFLGASNDYTSYTAQVTTVSTDFRLPDTTLDDAPGFFTYIKF